MLKKRVCDDHEKLQEEEDQSDWDKLRRDLGHASSSCLMTTLKYRLSESDDRTQTWIQAMKQRTNDLNTIPDHDHENSNPNIKSQISVQSYQDNSPCQEEQDPEHIHKAHLQLCHEYYKSVSVDRAIQKWIRYVSYRRLSKHRVSRAILKRMFKRWRRYRQKSQLAQSASRSIRRHSVPRFNLKGISIRHQVIAESGRGRPLSTASTSRLRSIDTIRVRRIPASSRTDAKRTAQTRAQSAASLNVEPSVDAEADKEHNMEANETKHRITSPRQCPAAESKESGCEVEPDERKTQLSEAALLYRCRMRLSRLHYHRCLLIDYGWRPWRCLIELQHRRHVHCRLYYREHLLRRYTRRWRSRLSQHRDQIAAALHLHRLITCRSAYRSWISAIASIAASIEHNRIKIAIRRWCAFMKRKDDEARRMGIRPKMKRCWMRWRRVYHEAKRAKYRQDLLTKVHDWLKDDDLGDII